MHCPDCNRILVENPLSYECSDDNCNFYMGKKKYYETYIQEKKVVKMTKYHKNQAEIRYELDGFFCQICGKPLNELGVGCAHRIPKGNIKKYGEKIINHNINLVPACLKCNQKVLINNNEIKKEKLLELVRMNLPMKFKEINEYLEGL